MLDGKKTYIMAIVTFLVAIAPMARIVVTDAEEAIISDGVHAIILMVSTLATMLSRKVAKT